MIKIKSCNCKETINKQKHFIMGSYLVLFVLIFLIILYNYRINELLIDSKFLNKSQQNTNERMMYLEANLMYLETDFRYLKSNFSQFESDVIQSYGMIIHTFLGDWIKINNINEIKLQEQMDRIQQKCSFDEPDRELTLFQFINKDKIKIKLVQNNSKEIFMTIYSNYSIYCLNKEIFELVDCLTLC